MAQSPPGGAGVGQSWPYAILFMKIGSLTVAALTHPALWAPLRGGESCGEVSVVLPYPGCGIELLS
jgi:hypothetical protein